MAVERGAAQQGQTVRLKAVFRLSGNLIDPHQIRQVEVRSSANAVLATFTGSSIVHESLGTFYVDWTIATSEPANVHYDRWYATCNNGAVEVQFEFHFLVLSFSVTTPGAAYMTPAEVREFLPEEAEATDADLQYQVGLGQDIIENKTGRNFLPITEARTFDGSGRQVQPVDPILRVSEAKVLGCHPICDDTGTLIDPCLIRITRSRTFLALGNVVPGSQRWHHAQPLSFGCCGVWPAGTQNIQITGDWGLYDTVPRPIKAALGALIREAMRCDDARELPSAEFEAEAMPGDRRYTLRKVWQSVTVNAGTGYPSIDAILYDFTRQVDAATV